MSRALNARTKMSLTAV